MKRKAFGHNMRLILFILYYYGGFILTIFAFLTHFLFAPNNLVASIAWALICGIYFYSLCLVCTRQEHKIKFKNSLFMFFSFLFIYFCIMLGIFGWRYDKFIDGLISSLFFALYCSASTIDLVFILAKIHILKAVKTTETKKP